MKSKIRVQMNDGVYTCNTLTLVHEECAQKMKSKQRWEHMSMLGVLQDWPDIICSNCRDRINMRKEGL